MCVFLSRFFSGSLLLCPAIGSFLLFRRLFRNALSPKMRYGLWIPLLALFLLPLLPLHLADVVPGFSLWNILENSSFHEPKFQAEHEFFSSLPEPSWQMNDFSLSVSSSPSPVILLLGGLWMSGMCAAGLRLFHAWSRLYAVRRSALPLENENLRHLYLQCLREAGISRNIPIYTTAYLKSPAFTGIRNPRIYLPLHLVSETSLDLRCLLLHELQHYRNRDGFSCLLMNLVRLIYWFHPLVRYALREMSCDRELACDASVLDLLEKDEYEHYGRTLLHFAEQFSRTSFPFLPGMGGSFRQMRRRILAIASYRQPSGFRKLKSLGAFCLILFLLLPFVPALSASASEERPYVWDLEGASLSLVDLSSSFEGYEGSFVLYDSARHSWQVYQMEEAAARFSPDSTWKIYDALMALEEGVISPDSSTLSWDGETYPFPVWNQDQDLASAMRSSVNWYFQSLDAQMGNEKIRRYVRQIGYGNEDVSGNPASYWLEDSLKISPVEQVMLLRRLKEDGFGFDPESVRCVEEALLLETLPEGTLYGKTGTGQVDGQEVNGWFVGFLERPEGTCFFALHLHGDSGASGSRAARIALSILQNPQP